MSPTRLCVLLATCLILRPSLHVHGEPVPATVPKPDKALRTDRHGDPLPPGAIARLGTVRMDLADLSSMACLVYPPDGKILATAGNSTFISTSLGGVLGGVRGEDEDASPGNQAHSQGPYLIRLWEAATGKLLRRFENAEFQLNGLAFSPDGKTLASAGLGRGLVLWDTVTGKQLRQLPVQGGARSVAFSPDGKTVAAGGGRHIQRWTTATGKKLPTLRGHTSAVVALAYSPRGKILASRSWDDTLRLWDMTTGKECRRLKGNWGWVLAVAFSPDGKQLASAAQDNTIRLWETTSGKQVRRWKGHRNCVNALAFSRDGRTLASAGWDCTIGLWETATGKELHRFRGRCGDVPGVAFAPDGKTLASVGLDRKIRRWDTATGKEVFWKPALRPGHQGPIESVAYSPDGRTVATGSLDGTVRLWQATTGKHLRLLRAGRDSVGGVAFSPDGKTLAAAGIDRTIYLWDTATGKEHGRLPGPGKSKAEDTTEFRSALAFSPDGKLLAAGGAGTALRLWDVPRRRLLRTLARKATAGPVSGVAFSPDGKLLAIADNTLAVQLWLVATGKLLATLEIDQMDKLLGGLMPLPLLIQLQVPEFVKRKETFARVVFSPDGKTLAAAGPDRRIALWDVASRWERRQYSLPNETEPAWQGSNLAFSPDGKTLVTTSWGREPIRLWEVATGREIRRFEGQERIRALAFSHDGTTLTTGGDADHAALVWDVTGLRRGGRLPRTRLTAEELEQLWSDLAGYRARRANRAVWKLVTAARQAVPFLAEHLAPLPAERVAQWVKDLDNKRYAVRARATQELERGLDEVEPVLRRALKGGPSPEVRHRLERLLARVPSERLRLGRAVAVLERLQSPPARDLLARFAKRSPEARLTQEAKAALERLARRTPAKP
jgi:WD40 repeat protein